MNERADIPPRAILIALAMSLMIWAAIALPFVWWFFWR
jgi:hypothetical protein